MRRSLVPIVLGLALFGSEAALAKFGISKTRVTLPRLRPPAARVLADAVAVDVRSGSPEVTGSHVSLVRSRLEGALRASGLYRLVDRPREADTVIRVTLDDLRAEVRDEVEMEKKRVKIGEKQVWNEKKKKYESEDIYGDRDQPVSIRVAEGTVNATVEVDGEGGRQSRDAGAAYHQRYKVESGVPSEASSEESLRRFLMASASDDIVAQVSFAPDPVEAMLAVNGELKPGNRFAESGLFDQALAEWSRRTYKGDTEAARLHNVGVAQEALAYKFPPHSAEHREHLEQAREHYRRALQLDPGEKYFKPPLERIEMSLGYADQAHTLAADLERFRSELGGRRRAQAPPPPPAAPTGAAPASKPAPARATPPRPASSAPAAGPTLSGSAGLAAPLRNGSFESSLSPWTTAGQAAIVEEPRRGHVLEVVAGAGGARVQQAVGVDVGEGATLSLDYKVTAGEGQLRVLVAYADATGRSRTSTLEVTAGEAPGSWSSWSGDLAALRPRPTRVTEVKIVVEGGSVRVDNVALTVR